LLANFHHNYSLFIVHYSLKLGGYKLGKNVVYEKSFSFSLQVIKLCNNLRENHEYIISDQLLKCGTSIGANISEGAYAQSKKDFINKLSIALKESSETEYWLRLIKEAIIVDTKLINELIEQVQEIIKLLIAIINKAKTNLQQEVISN